MKTGAIVQARLGSTRLPRKQLLEIPEGSGVTVLERVVKPLMASEILGAVIVTTPDYELVRFCKVKGYQSYRWQGARDPLGELWHAAKRHKLDVIVRITADCPLMRTDIVDGVLEEFFTNGMVDYAYNHHDSDMGRGDGLDVEVFTLSVLHKAHISAYTAYDREHVTPWIRRHSRTMKTKAPNEESLSLNTMDDFKKISDIMRRGKRDEA